MTPMTFCNMMDLPAITVPAWTNRDTTTGLVPGIMLACAPGAEGTLLDVAAALRSRVQQSQPSEQRFMTLCFGVS